MKARKILFAIFLLIFSLINPTDSIGAVTPVAGKACKPAGTTQIYKNLKFTCVKTGKKLIWVSQKIIIQDTLQPKELTFDNLSLDWTPRVAKANLENRKKLNDALTFEMEILKSENVTDSRLKLEIQNLQIAQNFFGIYFKKTKFIVVFFTELDGKWADNKLNSLGIPSNVSQEIENISKNGMCNFASATMTDKKIPLYYQCLDTRFNIISDNQTAIHEFFHLIQQDENGAINQPCWLLEGSPTYFGIALGIEKYDSSGKSTKEFWKILSYQYDPPESLSLDPKLKLFYQLNKEGGVIEAFKKMEFKVNSVNDRCTSFGAYSLGGIATEILIATKDFEVYMEFVQASQQNSDWKVNFKKYFGITPDEFYEKISSYVKSKIDYVQSP